MHLFFNSSRTTLEAGIVDTALQSKGPATDNA